MKKTILILFLFCVGCVSNSPGMFQTDRVTITDLKTDNTVEISEKDLEELIKLSEESNCYVLVDKEVSVKIEDYDYKFDFHNNWTVIYINVGKGYLLYEKSEGIEYLPAIYRKMIDIYFP